MESSSTSEVDYAGSPDPQYAGQKSKAYDEKASVKLCQYIGSFAVAGKDHESRSEFVRQKLEKIQKRKIGKNVLMVISVTGIKLLSHDDKSVHMAHAIHRISYATCDAVNSLFAFIAREPRGHYSLQYCHTFTTSTNQQAEELNNLVGNAFKIAFSNQCNGNRQPSFSSLISKQIKGRSYQGQHKYKNDDDENNNNGVSREVDVASPNRRTKQTGGNKDKAQSKPLFARLWAKKQQTRHKEPILNMEVASQPSYKSNSEMSLYKMKDSSDSNRRGCVLPDNLPLSARLSSSTSFTSQDQSPSGSSVVSSDDNNSSPVLEDNNRNLDKHDKPSIVKSLNTLTTSNYRSPDLLVSCDGLVSSKNTLNLKEPKSVGRKVDFTNENSDDNDILKRDMTSSSLSSPSMTSLLSCSSSLPPHYAHQFSPISRKGTSSPQTIVNEHADGKKSDEVYYKQRRKFLGRFTTSASPSPPPPLPERHDSLTSEEQSQEEELKMAPWFQAGIPREIALEVLSREPVGAFMVRQSTTRPDCFALSLRVEYSLKQPSGIAHYLILNTNRGYKIKGFTKEFSTLTSLITHHSVMPELLPCPLSLSRYNANFTEHDDDSPFTEEDPDYETLSDFRKIMSDLNV